MEVRKALGWRDADSGDPKLSEAHWIGKAWWGTLGRGGLTVSTTRGNLGVSREVDGRVTSGFQDCNSRGQIESQSVHRPQFVGKPHSLLCGTVRASHEAEGKDVVGAGIAVA